MIGFKDYFGFRLWFFFSSIHVGNETQRVTSSYRDNDWLLLLAARWAA
jgi:hypothetical protein